MIQKKLEAVLKDAWDAGENDTITEDHLIEGAQLYIDDQVSGHLTDDQHEEVIEAYRMGFMGQKMGGLKPEAEIKKLKASLKKMRESRDYYRELYEYNNEEM